MTIRTFRDLAAWQRGMDVARAIYAATQQMPKSEAFGLTSQMRRAATSIPMNIAEGFGKHTRPEFLKGLRTAMGSLFELMTAHELAASLGLIPNDQTLTELLREEDRIVQALIRSLERKTKHEEQARTKARPDRT